MTSEIECFHRYWNYASRTLRYPINQNAEYLHNIIQSMQYSNCKLFFLVDSAHSTLVCQRYADISEPGHKSATTTVCRGEERVRNIFMSSTHEVHVEIVPMQHSHVNTAQFLIKYQGELSGSIRQRAKGLCRTKKECAGTIYITIMHFAWHWLLENNNW